jgi:hypothetical protein
MKYKRIAVDTSKSVFTLHGIDAEELVRGTHLGQRACLRINRPDT